MSLTRERRQIQQQWRRNRRLRQYGALMELKAEDYGIRPTKGVEAEARRLIQAARTINPQRHLRRASYRIDPLMGMGGKSNRFLKRIKVGPQASPFVIAHELGHLLPKEKGATKLRLWSNTDVLNKVILEEEAKASRHAMRILHTAGYKDSALRRMQAQAMAAYETYRTQHNPDAAYARLMRNPIVHLFPPKMYPPHKRKRARHLYNLLRKGRAQKVVALGKALR